jgi:DNA anti-recombination protein RmuC
MSLDEIERKEEEQPPKEEIPVPLYFDRYVASEIRSLREQIVSLDRRIEERFVQVDRRFADLKESMDERFVQFEKRIDERFARSDERIDNLQESVDKLGANIKWIIGLFSPVIAGILAMIVKMFFGP